MGFVTPPPGAFENKLLHVQDQKPHGTVGGATVALSFVTRDIATALTNQIGATLTPSQITLPAGTYQLEAWGAAHHCGQHQAAIYDVTNAAYLLYGLSGYTIPGSTYNTEVSIISGRLVLTASTTLELRHYASTSYSAGLGNPATPTGGYELYADVKIWRI